MRKKISILFTASLLAMLLLGMYTMSPAPGVELKVVKVDGVWRVVDASDYTKFKVKVKKNAKIQWTVEGSDAYFQFPDFLFDADSPADSLTNGYTKFVKDGKKLKLKVKSDVLADTYEYAVFCTANGAFAIGGSPPKIIIE